MARMPLVVLFLASLLGGCSAYPDGPPLETGRAAIVGGAADYADPAVVVLRINDGDCTGTLISPKVVLTAAHCTEGASAGEMDVFFGNDSSQAGTWIPVIHAEGHPTADIAVVTMQSSGPAEPVPISQHAFAAGDQGLPVRVVGFGVTSEFGEDSGIKREAATTISEWDSGLVYLDGYTKDTCYGDSGGPAFMTMGGVEQIVGVTSFGTAVCGNEVSGEVRVDVVREWIVAYLSQHDVVPSPPPSSCGADGACSAGCAEPDPDCPTCGSDGVCRTDCPKLDLDCCVTDGQCQPACRTADRDCKSGADGSQNENAAVPDDTPTPGGADTSCRVGRGASTLWPWGLIAVGWALRRRKGRAGRRWRSD